MTSLLSWSDATRQDRAELQRFCCTHSGRKVQHAGRWELQHPRPWELHVQSNIRNAKPPVWSTHGEFMFVGRDEQGIGAVVFYCELDGPRQAEIRTAAVAMHHRHRGGGVADEMGRVLLDHITTRAMEQGVDIVTVSAWGHEENRSSQALCRRIGLVHTASDHELQLWASEVLVAGAELDG